jgi:hypothetical protein
MTPQRYRVVAGPFWLCERREMQGILVGLGVISSIFWMYVGWEAMRAHQRLAAAMDELARKTRQAA